MVEPCLLVDIDGTLALSDELYVKAFEALMKDFDIDGVDEAWFAVHVAGKVDDDVFRAFLPAGHTADDLKRCSQKKDALFVEMVKRHGATIVPGLGATLAHVKRQKLRCVAVSNAQRGGCEAILGLLRDRLEHGDAITDLVVGTECARAKPDPEPYLEAMRRLGVQPHHCVVFEDSRTGIRAGVDAGVAAVVGMRTSLDHAALLEAGATHTVADWSEVDGAFIRSLFVQQLEEPA